MNQEAPGPFRKRIVFSILMPVLLVGIIICLVSTGLIMPPIVNYLRTRVDAELRHASETGLQICENHLNYLLDLRLEEDREMNVALQKEAAEEIKNIADHFEGIHLMVVDGRGEVVAPSTIMEQPATAFGLTKASGPAIRDLSFWGQPVRTHYLYFPFWDWFVVAYIHEADYRAPLVQARHIIYGGTFGLLIAIWLVLWAAVSRLISAPLQRLADATGKVSEGDLTPLANVRRDEIGRVVDAFNRMVVGLQRKNQEVASLITALRDSETRYRALFDGAAEGILVAEAASRRIRYANATICRMLGYTEAQLIDMPMMALYPHEEAAQAMAEFDAQVQGTGQSMRADVPCRCSDGAVIYADIKATPLTIDGIACVLKFLTDVTARRNASLERKELQNRLHRSEKMEAIGLLAGGVAHDLNNILSGLVSYPELILMDLPRDSPLRAPVKTIEKSGQRAAAIVQDLLTLARRGVAVSQATNLNRIVVEYFQSPEHETLRHYHPKVSFSVNLHEGLLDILGSPVHLAKSVMNLVSNAAEATHAGRGHVAVSTHNQYVDRPVRGYDEVKEGDYAVLTVSDDGVGIAPENQKRIFEPFYSKKVMGRSGTGLGMAVVWGTVKDHNGYIDLISGEDRGTTIALYFPVTRDTRIRETVGQKTTMPNGHGERILVVDDVPEQRDIAMRILTRLGYSVATVPSGEAAIDYLQDRQVDLLVLDMIMDPGMDGLDTYRRILQFRPGQRAIIASGFSENDRVRETLRLGAHQYVKKPYTLESIGLAVNNALENS